MMWKTDPKPEPLQHSVLASTAMRLGLEYWEREPFRLDGVFYEHGAAVAQNFPFPILVAIEHEFHRRGFDTEIARLLSVRCPLKVGITYSPRSKFEENLSRLKASITSLHEKIGGSVGEDPKSEYLFLVGIEKEPFDLAWWALSFRTIDGPRDSEFIMT
jgi:hypothetical protein